MAQQVKNLTGLHEVVDLILGPTQWVKDPALPQDDVCVVVMVVVGAGKDLESSAISFYEALREANIRLFAAFIFS